MTTTPQSVNRARYELTLRLAQFIETRQRITAGAPRNPSLLEEVINVTNDIGELFAAYEAAVREEAFRDLRGEVYASVADAMRARIDASGDPSDIAACERLIEWAQRQRANARRAAMESVGSIAERVTGAPRA